MFNKIKSVWVNSDPILKMVAKLYIIAILIILIFPFLLTHQSFLGIDFSTTGQIGDTIGGLMGPFVAIIAASLTFFAFWVQYRANQIQIRNFNNQRKDIQIERFQNKFYELLRLHKENIQMIHSISSNKDLYFKSMIDELKIIYQIIEKFYIEFEKTSITPKLPADNIIKEKVLSLSYTIFWLGLNLESRRIINQLFKKKFDSFFIAKLYEEFDDVHSRYLNYKLKSDKPVTIYFKNFEEDVIILKIDKEILKERSSELGHYFRHIFQTIKFIDDFDSNLLSDKEKYGYAKNLRAQLSNYEQVLLYFNIISPFGLPWLEIKNNDLLSSYLTKYKMIKNIPLPSITFGIRPEVKFEKEIELLRKKDTPEELFEWHEIAKRL